jgi:prepilin-type N-terminal cleavage/methylation domain-containing protein
MKAIRIPESEWQIMAVVWEHPPAAGVTVVEKWSRQTGRHACATRLRRIHAVGSATVSVALAGVPPASRMPWMIHHSVSIRMAPRFSARRRKQRSRRPRSPNATASLRLRRRTLAFTLIELLVVVAIIAILAALLLAALSSAKLQAQQTQCISNLKELALAHNMYADEFANGIPNVAGFGYINPWETMLGPYDGNSPSLPLCPSASRLPASLSLTNGTLDVDGTADTAWYLQGNVFAGAGPGSGMAGLVYSVTNSGSYAFNGWLYDPWGVPPGAVPGFFRKPSAVLHASLTPVFADSVTHDVLPNPLDLPATNLYLGVGEGQSLAGSGLISVITIARHGSRPASAAPTDVNIKQRLPGMIDVAFVDGHIQKSPLENLWNYSWTSTWKIPNPRPGLP